MASLQLPTAALAVNANEAPTHPNTPEPEWSNHRLLTGPTPIPPRNEPLLYIPSAANNYQQLPLKLLYLCYHRGRISLCSTLDNSVFNCRYRYSSWRNAGAANFFTLIPEGLETSKGQFCQPRRILIGRRDGR